MDPQLQCLYRRTFITVEEPNELIAVKRAKSLPPERRAISDEATEAQVKESELADYVARLAGNAAHFFGQRSNRQQVAEVHSETKADATDSDSLDPTAHTAPIAHAAQELASRGSLGHPDVCRRPCVYFKSGSCEHGSSCGFCHMEHTLRLPKLDKKQRELIKSLNKTEVLLIMLRYLRLVAVKQGFELQATEILKLVEHEVLVGQDQAEANRANIPEKMFSRLHKTLIRMHFAGIVGLASKEQIGSKLRQDLADALERLRILSPQIRLQTQE